MSDLKENDPCAAGHDFRPFKGSAKCHDCGEMADCTETGALKVEAIERSRRKFRNAYRELAKVCNEALEGKEDV